MEERGAAMRTRRLQLASTFQIGTMAFPKVDSITQAIILSRQFDCLLPTPRLGRSPCRSINTFGSMRLVTEVGLALGVFLTVLSSAASTGHHD